MQHAASLVISAEFRALVTALVESFGSVKVVAAPGWHDVADQFDIEVTDPNPAHTLIVGTPAAVLKHARGTQADFGFVTPDAQFAKRWQRAPQWRDDTTLELWKLGWSLLRVDRLLVPIHGATIEYVIGSARRTPTTEVPSPDDRPSAGPISSRRSGRTRSR